MLIRDPVLQELNRRVVAERGVAATPVVEHFNVIEQIGSRILPRRVACAMHPFVLQAVKETLRRCVVPAVTLAAHRAHHAVFSELALERMARVLTAPIRVVDQPCGRLSAEPRHRQRIQHNVHRHPRLDRPADDLAVEQIEHDPPDTP